MIVHTRKCCSLKPVFFQLSDVRWQLFLNIITVYLTGLVYLMRNKIKSNPPPPLHFPDDPALVNIVSNNHGPHSPKSVVTSVSCYSGLGASWSSWSTHAVSSPNQNVQFIFVFIFRHGEKRRLRVSARIHWVGVSSSKLLCLIKVPVHVLSIHSNPF